MNVQAILDDPHILSIYGAFEDDTFIYMVQQLADQGDIYKTYLAQRIRLTEKDLVIKIVHPLLKAIEHAHKCGVVHRCATVLKSAIPIWLHLAFLSFFLYFFLSHLPP
jgi:serine/threonine protein kinase